MNMFSNKHAWLLVSAAVCLASASRDAHALRCRRPPTVSVIYPANDAAVPRNTVILLTRYRSSPPFQPRLLVLRDRAARKTVRDSVHVSPAGGLVRLVPKTLLAAGRTYEIRYEGTISLGRTGALGSFRTTSRIHRGPRPRLGKATISFSKVILTKWAGRGRTATVRLSQAGSTRPVAVEVIVGRSPGRRSFAVNYARVLSVANMSPCSWIGRVQPTGWYNFTLVPWSASGKRGAPKVLKGTIR